MVYPYFISVIVLLSILSNCLSGFKFIRKIEATGLPYYKIQLRLGECKESVIFKEQKIWPALRFNSLLDIYYNSSNDRIKVSRAEITLIINNTNFLAFSETGVNRNEFRAKIVFSLNMGIMLYALILYTCDKDIQIVLSPTEKIPQIPFYVYKKPDVMNSMNDGDISDTDL